MEITVIETDFVRVDKYISEKVPEISRSFAAKLLEEGRVLANGEKIGKNYKVKEGDILRM